MTTTYKRLAGPAALGTSTATLYTAPAGGAVIDYIRVQNPSGGSTRQFTCGVGVDAAGTRIADAVDVPSPGCLEIRGPIALGNGELFKGHASNAALVITASGREFS